jgi:ribosome recycling factor
MNNSDYLSKHQTELEKAIEFLKQDISGLRTGRANPSIVENIMVEAYETHMQLTAVASVSTPDSRTIQIEPWDKSVVKAVEKAIIDSKLGLMPNTAGTVIRIIMPPLTEENRKNMVKVLGDKLENARKTIRAVRDEARAEIVAAEREGEVGEDEKYRLLEDLDKTCSGFNDRIKHIGDEKEKEIMTV